MADQKDKVIDRLENLHKNLDTGLTRDRYFEMQEQMGVPPRSEDVPPDWEDFPDIVVDAVNTFNQLGDRAYPDIGYIGKDYTNLPLFLDLYGISDTEFFIHILTWLDSRAIKKSQERLKREHDKLKRTNTRGKHN